MTIATDLHETGILPLVPRSIRRAFHVDEKTDSRFTGCARLLQSIWRADHEFPVGRHKTPDGKSRKLGSRLAPADAEAGANFLSAEIAKAAWNACAYREPGALIEEGRLWGNLLSSQSLTFNLFGMARTDRDFATAVFSALAPDIIKEAHAVRFEHSPGRGDPAYIGDHTALDVLGRRLIRFDPQSD